MPRRSWPRSRRDRGTPILAVEPGRAKEQLEALPWVRSASIERRLPDTLYVRLVERHPLAVWQHDGKQELIDRDGAVIPVERSDPLCPAADVVGDDAASHGRRAARHARAASPSLPRGSTAAVRVGDRRWNVRIDNAIDVLLPEDDTAGAWAPAGASSNAANSLLQRDVQTVDLRLPDRLVCA